MNRGILYAAGAYLLWGFLPVYWKALQSVSATQILSHRIVWSVVFLAALITWRRDWPILRQAIATPKTLFVGFLAACLLTVNWLTYIWGVNAGFVVETSLGYFINPLVNVLLGVLFLRERLRPWQWLPVGLATAGVLYLTLSYGSLPWIALTLAFSFGLYGLIKKTASLGALTGLMLETGILFSPAILNLLYLGNQGAGAFGSQGLATDALLAGTGIVSALPLLLFGMGARRIHLITLGILQYIAPTCQFLLGVLVYGEPFTQARLVGFGLIWAALVIYSAEGIVAHRKSRSPLSPTR
jgi:chloramphenicol-sensitive protein RarD